MSDCTMSKYSTHSVTKRRRFRRRNTISHPVSCCSFISSRREPVTSAPPAPPSTPTSLTPTGTVLPMAGQHLNEMERLDNFLYILDYAPKYKKKLKEQQCTDAELAELFNVVSLSSTSKAHNRVLTKAASSTLLTNSAVTYGPTSILKLEPERGVSAMSRTIHKHSDSGTTKIFKVHRNIRELLHDTDEEKSVSAPEFDTEEETRFHRLGRVKTSRLLLANKRRGLSRFRYNQRMDSMIDTFDMAMNFNDV